jgi:hypothetical protein
VVLFNQVTNLTSPAPGESGLRLQRPLAKLVFARLDIDRHNIGGMRRQQIFLNSLENLPGPALEITSWQEWFANVELFHHRSVLPAYASQSLSALHQHFASRQKRTRLPSYHCGGQREEHSRIRNASRRAAMYVFGRRRRSAGSKCATAAANRAGKSRE